MTRAARSFSAVAACSLLSAWCLLPATAYGQGWGVYTMNADGSDLKRVYYENNTSFGSPDGNKLLFRIANESGFEQIHVLDLDGGGQPAPLQNQFGRGNSDAVWSADGKQIFV
ncbi:MAG TPA: hypothetical protein VG125_26340 [Pirellulales bacterium]|jgi:Tol biopolymer transport system component|nr:hypothetical protein [Pirellulales bacterium]